jgi:hypothetical protein
MSLSKPVCVSKNYSRKESLHKLSDFESTFKKRLYDSISSGYFDEIYEDHSDLEADLDGDEENDDDGEFDEKQKHVNSDAVGLGRNCQEEEFNIEFKDYKNRRSKKRIHEKLSKVGERPNKVNNLPIT